MAVQILNEMPDAEVHRGDPVEAFAARTQRAARASQLSAAAPVFIAITVGLHVVVALALMRMQFSQRSELSSRRRSKPRCSKRPPMRATAADIHAAADGRRVFAADAAGNHHRDARRVSEVTGTADHFIRARDQRSRRRWSSRWNTCAPHRRCIRGNRSASREHGTVVLRVLVDAHGRPAQIQVERSSGFERLDAAAREAVEKFLFRPYEVNGVAQPAQVLIPIEFDRRAS